MKKLSLLVLFAAVMAVGAQAQSSDDTTVGVGVAIGNALEITKVEDLFFGTFATATAGDTIKVNAQTGAATVGVGNTMVAPTDHSRGELDIVGANDAEVFINTGVSTLQLVRDGGAEEAKYDLALSVGGAPITGASLVDGVSADLDASGELTIFLGGNLIIDDTVGGFYRGEITVTVSYF